MQHAQPSILTIVGITGDLSNRYLLPSLYHLEKDGLLPSEFAIVGTSRRAPDTNEFRKRLQATIIKTDGDCNEAILKRFIDRIHLVKADISNPEDYKQLSQKLEQVEKNSEVCMPHVFYLAIPPKILSDVVELIGHKEVHKCGHGADGRLLVEKPFGNDLESAKQISKTLKTHFKEEQIFRIDHYLAKETAQNILHFRFKNPLVHDIWNSKFIHHIQITAAESIGIEGRVNFYEQTGAVRDFLQSHLLQLLALTTMEKPDELDAANIRARRNDLLAQLKPIQHKDVKTLAVRGQYEGYTKEVGKQTSVETYVALKAEIDNDRWRGVPIYLRTGKNLETRITEITLVYEDPEIKGSGVNLLTIRIQPNEGIALKVQAKRPGLDNVRQDIILDYCYERSDDVIKHNAYERLLIDAMRGDQSLFPSTEEIINSWKYIQPLIDDWKHDDDIPKYQAGSWGPSLANELIERDGNEWIVQGSNICMPS